MKENAAGFVFEEHIKKADFSLARNKLEKRLRFFSRIPKLERGIEERIKDVKRLQERTDRSYRFLSWFFDELQSQEYCNAIYSVSDVFLGSRKGKNEFYKVNISGSGLENFEINGFSSFDTSADRKLRKTIIPVLEGDAQEAKLILFDYPLTEIPLFGKLNVEYEFETYFNLGCYQEGEPLMFTNNLLKIAESGEKVFYGKPGRLAYREGDLLSNELNRGVTGIFYGEERDRLKIQAKIFSGGQLFYQGNMECRGTWPFFIRKGRDKPKEKKIMPKNPAGNMLIPA